jgi:hypothetical protein
MALGMRRAFIPKVYAGDKKKHSKTKTQQAAIAIAKKKKEK